MFIAFPFASDLKTMRFHCLQRLRSQSQKRRKGGNYPPVDQKRGLHCLVEPTEKATRPTGSTKFGTFPFSSALISVCILLLVSVVSLSEGQGILSQDLKVVDSSGGGFNNEGEKGTTHLVDTTTPGPQRELAQWWVKYRKPRPTLASHDIPRGTGVASWKEIDLFSRETRLKGGKRYQPESEASISQVNQRNSSPFIATLGVAFSFTVSYCLVFFQTVF